MDISLLAIVASLLVFLIVLITWYSRQSSNKGKTAVSGPAVRGAGSRRVGAVRGVRQRRGRGAVEGSAGDQEQEHQDEGNEAEREDDRADELTEQSKLGAKKRAKLEAKAERKAQREIDARDREERKKREQRLQEQRDKESEREKEEERRREEAEKALREEKERREQEEYLKLKQAFSVDEEGFEDKFEGRSEEEHKNTFAEILAYAKRAKVVVLEDLAREFGINTMVIINWIQQMLADGILTGVIDDRGKFIYVSQKEFDAVAKFIKQRGRISIAELAEHTSQLINLQPVGNLGTVAE